MNRLKKIMKDRGLSMTDLVVMTRLSYPLFVHVRRGYIPSEETQKRIADALGVPVEEIFPEVDDANQKKEV